MDLKQFDKESSELIAKIEAQNPVAIVKFGGSTRPEEYIPGASDLDLFVVSDEPLQDTENNVGFEYFLNQPQSTVDGLFQGNPFVMSAIMDGEAVYDPHGFVKELKEKAQEEGVGPTNLTVHMTLQSVGNQLSSAMNRYFSDPNSEEGSNAKLLRNVHLATRGVCSLRAMIRGKGLQGSYSGLLKALVEDDNDFAAELIKTKGNLINHEDISPKRIPPIRGANIGLEDLGTFIKEAEWFYNIHDPLKKDQTIVSERSMTSDLITAHEQAHGPLDEIRAVRINNINFTHVILGKVGDKHYLFGRDYRSGKGPVDIPSSVLSEEHTKKMYSALHMIR